MRMKILAMATVAVMMASSLVFIAEMANDVYAEEAATMPEIPEICQFDTISTVDVTSYEDMLNKISAAGSVPTLIVLPSNAIWNITRGDYPFIIGKEQQIKIDLNGSDLTFEQPAVSARAVEEGWVVPDGRGVSSLYYTLSDGTELKIPRVHYGYNDSATIINQGQLCILSSIEGASFQGNTDRTPIVSTGDIVVDGITICPDYGGGFSSSYGGRLEVKDCEITMGGLCSDSMSSVFVQGCTIANSKTKACLNGYSVIKDSSMEDTKLYSACNFKLDSGGTLHTDSSFILGLKNNNNFYVNSVFAYGDSDLVLSAWAERNADASANTGSATLKVVNLGEGCPEIKVTGISRITAVGDISVYGTMNATDTALDLKRDVYLDLQEGAHIGDKGVNINGTTISNVSAPTDSRSGNLRIESQYSSETEPAKITGTMVTTSNSEIQTKNTLIIDDLVLESSSPESKMTVTTDSNGTLAGGGIKTTDDNPVPITLGTTGSKGKGVTVAGDFSIVAPVTVVNTVSISGGGSLDAPSIQIASGNAAKIDVGPGGSVSADSISVDADDAASKINVEAGSSVSVDTITNSSGTDVTEDFAEEMSEAGASGSIGDHVTYSVSYMDYQGVYVTYTPWVLGAAAPTVLSLEDVQSTTESEVIEDGYTFLGWSSLKGTTVIDDRFPSGSAMTAPGDDYVLYPVAKKTVTPSAYIIIDGEVYQDYADASRFINAGQTVEFTDDYHSDINIDARQMDCSVLFDEGVKVSNTITMTDSAGTRSAVIFDNVIMGTSGLKMSVGSVTLSGMVKSGTITVTSGTARVLDSLTIGSGAKIVVSGGELVNEGKVTLSGSIEKATGKKVVNNGIITMASKKAVLCDLDTRGKVVSWASQQIQDAGSEDIVHIIGAIQRENAAQAAAQTSQAQSSDEQDIVAIAGAAVAASVASLLMVVNLRRN